MPYFYSATTGWFYEKEFGLEGTPRMEGIPPDAVEISDARHKTLFDGQSSQFRIVPGADGYPVLVAEEGTPWVKPPEQIASEADAVNKLKARDERAFALGKQLLGKDA